MTPENHVAIVAPTAGSDFYYATLYCSRPEKYQLHAFESVRRTITSIPSTCSDRGVAHTKLAWWHEELERVSQGEPRHELAAALVQLIPARSKICATLRDLVTAVDNSLLERAFEDADELNQALSAQHGQCIAQIARLEQRFEQDIPKTVLQLGYLVELSYFMRGLRLRRSEPSLYIAHNHLREFGLNIDRVRYAGHTDELREWVVFEVERLHAALTDTLAKMTGAEKRRYQVITCLARIQLHALGLCREDGCSVLERRIEVTPISKLLYALRTRWGI